MGSKPTRFVCNLDSLNFILVFRSRTFLIGAVLALLAGCQSRPVRELILSDVALRAAQKEKADALSPDDFRKAENYYLRAKKDFAEGYYDASRKHADQARILAEKAEYRARWKQLRAKEKNLNESSTAPPSEGDEE